MDAAYTGNKIFQLRKEKNLTQKQLADMVGVTDKAVSKWERGINFPDLITLEKLAETLDTSVIVLLGIERHSGEQIASEISDIAWWEKELIISQLRGRGRTSVIFGIITLLCSVYASKIFAENGLYGRPVLITMGTTTLHVFLIANGFVMIAAGNRLLGKKGIFSKTAGFIRNTPVYNNVKTFLIKFAGLTAGLLAGSPVNKFIDSCFKEENTDK